MARKVRTSFIRPIEFSSRGLLKCKWCPPKCAWRPSQLWMLEDVLRCLQVPYEIECVSRCPNTPCFYYGGNLCTVGNLLVGMDWVSLRHCSCHAYDRRPTRSYRLRRVRFHPGESGLSTWSCGRRRAMTSCMTFHTCAKKNRYQELQNNTECRRATNFKRTSPAERSWRKVTSESSQAKDPKRESPSESSQAEDPEKKAITLKV